VKVTYIDMREEFSFPTSVGAGEKLFYSYAGEIYYYEGNKPLKES